MIGGKKQEQIREYDKSKYALTTQKYIKSLVEQFKDIIKRKRCKK